MPKAPKVEVHTLPVKPRGRGTNYAGHIKGRKSSRAPKQTGRLIPSIKLRVDAAFGRYCWREAQKLNITITEVTRTILEFILAEGVSP